MGTRWQGEIQIHALPRVTLPTYPLACNARAPCHRVTLPTCPLNFSGGGEGHSQFRLTCEFR